jgi:hypothetical protein
LEAALAGFEELLDQLEYRLVTMPSRRQSSGR